jgi:formamidopyrimidine-DNA glycosylase
MQGGRLKPDTSRAKKPKTGVARWVFAATSHPSLILMEAGTERRAGVWVVGGDPDGQAPLGRLGPEADTVDVAGMTALLAANSMRVHTFLREQEIVAGLGRRLADHIADGLADERAHDVMRPSRERPAAVHGRTGQPCPVCGDPVREVDYTRYTVHYCATCQTGGNILADNALSKLGISRAEQGLGRSRGRNPA